MIVTKPTTVTEYIAGFPEPIQLMLEQVRATIQQAAPDAQETIKYAMPTFVFHGNLVHFAAFKNHIGFYATPTGNGVFQQEISRYKGAKDSLQFPINQPMPLDLIKRLVEFRVKENLENESKKK